MYWCERSSVQPLKLLNVKYSRGKNAIVWCEPQWPPSLIHLLHLRWSVDCRVEHRNGQKVKHIPFFKFPLEMKMIGWTSINVNLSWNNKKVLIFGNHIIWKYCRLHFARIVIDNPVFISLIQNCYHLSSGAMFCQFPVNVLTRQIEW